MRTKYRKIGRESGSLVFLIRERSRAENGAQGGQENEVPEKKVEEVKENKEARRGPAPASPSSR